MPARPRPTPRPSARALSLGLAIALAGASAAAALLARSAAAAPSPDPSGLAPGELIDETRLALDAALGLVERVRAAEARLAVIDKALADRATERAQALAEPPPAPTGALGVEAARAEVDRLEGRARALTAVRALDAERRGLLAERTRLLDELALAAREGDPLRDRLALLAAEVRARLAAGALAREALGERLDPQRLDPERFDPLWAGLAALPNAERRAAEVERTRAAQALLEREAAAAGAEEQALSAARRVAGDRLEVERQKQALRQELGAADLGAVVSLLGSKLGGWEAALAEVASTERTLQATEAAALALAREHAALGAPNRDAIRVDDRIQSLAAAKAARLFAEARRDFHLGRRALAERQVEVLEARRQRLDDALAAVERAAERGLEIETLAEVAMERADAATDLDTVPTLPVAATPSTLGPQLAALRERRRALRDALEQAAGERETVAQALAADARALAEVDAALPDLVQAVEREEVWASFSRELWQLGPAELVSTFEATATALAAAGEEVTRLGAEADAGTEAIRLVQARLDQHVDPLVLQARPSLEGFRQAKIEELRAWLASVEGAGDAFDAASGSARATAAAVTTPAAPTASSASAERAAQPGASGLAARVAELEQERDALLARLRYFRDRRILRADLFARVDAQAALLRRLEQTLAERLELTRRAWGAAFVLEARAGELPGGQPPAGVADAARRERVSAAQAALGPAKERAQRNLVRLDRARSLDRGDAALAAALEARAALVTQQLGLFAELAALERDFPAKPLAELDEVAAKRLELDVEARLDREARWYETALGFFTGDDSEGLQSLLEGLYRALLDVERRERNVTARERRAARLSALAEASRPLLGALEPAIQERLARYQADYDIELARVRQALSPGRSEGAFASPSQRAAAALLEPIAAVPADAREVELPKLAARLYDPFTRVLAYRAWLGRVREAQGRFGSIDVEVAGYGELLASLEARRGELARERQGLTGRTDAELAALSEEERTDDPEGLAQLRDGEIGTLRKQLVRALGWQAAGTLLWVALVPLFALGALRAANTLGKRLVERARGDGAALGAAERREREERARTLYVVFRAAWRLLVLVLAGIYLLKAIHVDVTPLIASAGIVGLAVAFGAQSLVRDCIAGFFILLENQFNLGDAVQIDGVDGRVERITLRLTIIRDVEGVLHFIPNGTISRVSNRMKAWSQVKLEIGCAYKEDPDRVIAVLRKIGGGLQADPELAPRVLGFEVPGIESFGDNAVFFRVHIKVVAGEQWTVAREFRRRVKLGFDREGIEMPFPQRVVQHLPAGSPALSAAVGALAGPVAGAVPAAPAAAPAAAATPTGRSSTSGPAASATARAEALAAAADDDTGLGGGSPFR